MVRSHHNGIGRSGRAVAASMLTAAVLTTARSHGAPVDFSTFQVGQGIASANPAGNAPFATPSWQIPTTYNNVAVDPGRVAMETTNSDTNFLYGPGSLTLQNKIIRGDIYAGTDDDPIGIAIGLPQNPMLSNTADYLLLQWKGLSQTFDYVDVALPTDPTYSAFHDSTTGGSNAVGLSLSRVRGFPTADEFWQRSDLVMYNPQGKRAPDPTMDPPLGFDSGGLSELGRGTFYGTRPYSRSNRRHQLEIEYTPTNIKVWVDGSLEFNVDAPAGSPFPDGTLGLYEQAQDPSGAYAYFDVRDIGAPAPPASPDLNPAPTIAFSVAEVSVSNGTTNATSAWSNARGTGGPASLTVDTGPNIGDVEFSIGGQKLTRDIGVVMATVNRNGLRANGTAEPQYGGVEAASPSGFNGGTGLATFGMSRDGEWNTDVAAGHFPFAAGFTGGYVSPAGTLVASDNQGPTSPYVVTQKAVPLPSVVKFAYQLDGVTPSPAQFFAGNQQFMTNVRINGKDGNTAGLLFTIGTSNEDNYTSAAVLPDGSWNVAVRDGDSVFYGGPDTFEQDDFAFLYLEEGDVAGSVGGRVTGLNNGSPVVSQDWGSFSLSRLGTGRYALTITGGDAYEINILNQALVGDFIDNGDGTFTNTQDLSPTAVDSSFSFAFVPFTPGDAAGGGMLLLNPNDFVTLSDGTRAPLNYFMTYENVVPEPAGLGLAGLAGLGLARRRRRK